MSQRESPVLELYPGPDGTGPRPPPVGAALSPALRAKLLDPARWQEGLERYARATNLAVALTDSEGRLLGECINPQPLWSLFRRKKACGAGECPFCLADMQHCTCILDALNQDGLVMAHDRTGLAHFAVALLLGGQKLGALIAGQVFVQYPQQLPLEHAARQFGLPSAKVWELARREHPVKQATLQVYGDLLLTLGQTYLRTRSHELQEADRLAEMTRLRDRAVTAVADLQLAKEALKETDRRKDEFLAMLAHELRNPLAPIRNAVELLRLKAPADPELQWGREVIERQVRQLTRLVDDLLDVSRISRGKVNLHLESVELAAVVAQAVEISRPLIDARKHHLEVSLPAQAVRVEADPTRLAQVVSNLLNNAAKYTEEGGRIELTVEVGPSGDPAPAGGDSGAGRNGHPSHDEAGGVGRISNPSHDEAGGVGRIGNPSHDEAVLRVRDTGLGIAADVLPVIFDLFTQVQGSSSRSEGGLGIGLTLVRSLVEMHGGTVQAASAGLGHGSEFIVRLPLLRETFQPAPTAAKRAERPDRASPLRILVVDDNGDAAETLAMLLRLSGNEVRIAYDGPSALDATRAQPPDVVLCDIGLPGMDGLEVARRLRQDPKLKGSLLVALTGYGQDEDRRRSQEAGFNAHLIKPVDLEALRELLDRPKLGNHAAKGEPGASAP